MSSRKRRNIVVIGEVDHGKSSVLGRLLFECGNVPTDRLEQVEAQCRSRGAPFEYAYLLDALAEERWQGITIDAARAVLRLKDEELFFFDAPGHADFTRNLATGASQAEEALVVIDVVEGITPATRRQLTLLTLLALRRVIVVLNKIDLLTGDGRKVEGLIAELRNQISEGPKLEFVAVSAKTGAGISKAGERGSLLSTLTEQGEPGAENNVARFVVQDVYRLEERIVVGIVVSGNFSVGDEITLAPSGRRSRISKILSYPLELAHAKAGNAVGFVLEEHIYVSRGGVIYKSDEVSPVAATHVVTKIFPLASSMPKVGDVLQLRIGCDQTAATVRAVASAGNLAGEALCQYELELDRAVAADRFTTCHFTSRVILETSGTVVGFGLVIDAKAQPLAAIERAKALRESRWEKGLVPRELRLEKAKHNGGVVLITGNHAPARKSAAKALEALLFAQGVQVYYLGFGSLRYGLHSDLLNEDREAAHQEVIRRLGELSHILIDSGTLLIVTADSLSQSDVDALKVLMGETELLSIWIGGVCTTTLEPTLKFSVEEEPDQMLNAIRALLMQRRILKSW